MGRDTFCVQVTAKDKTQNGLRTHFSGHLCSVYMLRRFFYYITHNAECKAPAQNFWRFLAGAFVYAMC